ncbi:hypothetical protein KL906_001371 [Ogataea polymorpha]|nr:hypothetical protein KL906_001371 [Ogataea polymorpha]
MEFKAAPRHFYQNLGPSGLKISKVIVGCMSIGKKSWLDWVIEDEEEALALLKKAYDAGLRTFDTADVYSNGQSERLIAKFLKKYNIHRERVVILTKVFFPCDPALEDLDWNKRNDLPGEDFINAQGLNRRHIMEAVKNSVERLGTYIDVYQIHRFDPTTPIEETMQALHDCIQAGYVRYIGASAMKTWQFQMMQNVAEKHGWTKFISMQNYYNLLYREQEKEMAGFCKETGVTMIPYSPLARGLLCRPADSTSLRKETDTFFLKMYGLDKLKPSELEIIKRVEELSKKYSVPMAAVATAFVVSKGHCPIIGFNKPERIDDALTGLGLTLTEEDIKYLEEPYEIHEWFI